MSQEFFEGSLASVGLGSKSARAILLGGSTAMLIYFFRPLFIFDAKGNVRPWYFLSPGAPNATVWSPYLVIALAAFVGAFLF